MISYNQSIHEMNVVSCLYQVALSDLSVAFNDFITNITSAGYTIAGQLFYSINSDLNQMENMIVELFVPIEEDTCKLDDRFVFRTYFQLTDLMATRANGDTERDFSEAIQILINEIVDKNLTVKTPTFYKVYLTDNGDTFTDIMIGVRE